MSNYSKLTDSLHAFIRQTFPNVQCHIEHTEYQGTIHSFFLQCSTSQVLEEEWQSLSNAIAFHYQSKIESEFERWNFYLFYLVDTLVNRGLKFRIENDPISSRKIVIDNFKGTLTPPDIKDIIDEHITNRNVLFTLPKVNMKSSRAGFGKNELLAQAIATVPRTGNKKKIDDVSVQILKTIETHFINEIQKS
ncbi:ABC-three component system middle component 1 [Telluribacter sp.]|jgi:hypothetical protein|uniref:ABC-three component system middle component 1 n=1 Tax=Telluribacter sp. TaxID=1978767 RepID=UPI002E143D7A|nr:ABC-three component system middle component 1 [Telluribacter sp.]